MERQINKNLRHLVRCQQNEQVRGAVLEGSSRSGKTFSSIDFLVYLCSRIEKNAQIFIIKETYNSFKTTLYDDFNKQLPKYGIPSPFADVKECPSFWLMGNKVTLIGADKLSTTHGAGSDYLWFNEPLEIQKAIFDQYEQRCRKFWWMDLNPSVSLHWIYDMEKRPEVKFCHSTVMDNPYVPRWQKKKILGYDPSNPVNVANGTADDYMWSVYGLGLRASPTGLIYPNVTWIDQFPDDLDQVVYGLDFGYTHNPSALVKVGKNGMNLYLQLLLYEPVDNANKLGEMVRVFADKKKIWADSADPLMISDLRRRGLLVLPCVKKEGSVNWGISRMKEYKIHIVNDVNFKKEQENYKWAELHGIQLNEPVKAFDHAWDAARYATTMEWPAGR